MRMTRFGRQTAAWLGLLAIALNALTPLASLAGSRADVRTGICTASGFRFVPESPQAPSTPPSPAERSQCALCTHCAPSSGHAALGAANQRMALPWPDRTTPPRQYAATLFAVPWIPGARPRAPPTLFGLL
jgi:hypothetical protein